MRSYRHARFRFGNVDDRWVELHFLVICIADHCGRHRQANGRNAKERPHLVQCRSSREPGTAGGTQQISKGIIFYTIRWPKNNTHTHTRTNETKFCLFCHSQNLDDAKYNADCICKKKKNEFGETENLAFG